MSDQTERRTIRLRALEWLADEWDHIAGDVGEVATPLDDLPVDDERAAVDWVRGRIASLIIAERAHNSTTDQPTEDAS